MECRIAVSVVVPVFNEVGNLPELYAQLTKALDELQYELLFVDDGSTDGSYDALAAIHAKDRPVKVADLRTASASVPLFQPESSRRRVVRS